jgi:hypothetical protein
MVVSYRSFPTSRVKRSKLERIDRKDLRVLSDINIRSTRHGPTRKLTSDDITIHVRVDSGTESERDVNCDSSFMLDNIHEIGQAIRSKMDFVPIWEKIHLFIDNAGGHGTIEAKDKYEKILLDDYNVVLNWQVPQSPETNMLDLGAWMSIQHVVERLHRNRVMNERALSDTVLEAFDRFDGFMKLGAIARRWELVLDLILEDDGGNNLVETKRGVLTKPLIGNVLPREDIYALQNNTVDVS